jgi:hypothetical protein
MVNHIDSSSQHHYICTIRSFEVPLILDATLKMKTMGNISNMYLDLIMGWCTYKRVHF